MFKPVKTPVYLALILALSACGGGGSSNGATGSNSTSTVALSGKVVDGYINGATVFCDANNNGVLDAGEASTTTSGQGDFTLSSACSATLVSIGGTDVTTGYAFQGVLKTSSGAVVMSPLTTLVADSGLSNAQLVKALGLPEGTDLTKTDPVAPGNTAILKATLAVQQIVQQLANLTATANDASARTTLYTKVANALASTLAASSGATLFDANGSANTTLIIGTIQKAVENVNKDSSLKPVSYTTADIASVATQLGQQAEQFMKADTANLSNLSKQLQNPQLLPPQTETAKAYYISPKNDSVILNGTSFTLGQFSNPGITLAGLNTVSFEYTATAGTQVDVLADVGIALEEIGGQGRVLQVEVEQVHVERNATSGAVTLSLTPQTNVYVYAKDGHGSEVNVTVAQPSFNPVTIVNNAVTISYNTLVEKVIGNTTYNTTSLTPSQFYNLKGSFKARFVVSGNMNVRYQDGTALPVLSVGIANSSHSVSGPGIEGIVNIQ
jgi:hypothetical protein